MEHVPAVMPPDWPSRWIGIMIGRADARTIAKLLIAAVAAFTVATSQSVSAQVRGLPQSAPNDAYWLCFAPYYDGSFREAGAAFREAASGRIVTTAQTPWIDSICFHTMMGECSYQMGNLPDALDQYSTALKI